MHITKAIARSSGKVSRFKNFLTRLTLLTIGLPVFFMSGCVLPSTYFDSERVITAPWADHGPVQPVAQNFCYRSLGSVECFDASQGGRQSQVVTSPIEWEHYPYQKDSMLLEMLNIDSHAYRAEQARHKRMMDEKSNDPVILRPALSAQAYAQLSAPEKGMAVQAVPESIWHD